LVAAGESGAVGDGGFGGKWRGLADLRDGLECAERLGHERPGLFAPGEVLFAAGFGEGVAKRGGTEPVADGVAVDADEIGGGGGGGAGGEEGEGALLGGG